MKYWGWIISGAAVAGIALSSAPVFAQEVYVQGGTQGGGVGAALGLTNWLGLHADLNGFNISHSFRAGGNKFDSETHIRHAGLYADLFPFANNKYAGGFRVTAGAMFTRDRLEGVAVPTNGYYNVNGIAVPAALLGNQQAIVRARFPTVMPYLGLGWGHKPVSKGFGFIADVGVAYGRPIVDFSTPGILGTLAGSQLQAEENSIRSTIQHYKLYPVVQVGVSYRF